MTRGVARPRQLRVLEDAACLGCGCTCDDIHLHVRDDRIVEARQACALGVAWFGMARAGSARSRAVSGGPTSEAVEAMARVLHGGRVAVDLPGAGRHL